MLPIEEIKNIRFVFIVGRGRSGTSLLQTILDCHPQVISAEETTFILVFKKRYNSVKKWTSILIAEFINDLYEDLRFNHLWKVNRLTLQNYINQYPLEQISYSILCKLVYLNFPSPHKKEQIKWLIDKNPMYSLYMEDMREIFPDSKFIHIIRDYRDNIISRRKSFNQKDIALLANEWVESNKAIDAFSKHNIHNIYNIKYEELANQPKQTMMGICSFMNIKYTEEMLSFYITKNKTFQENTDIVSKPIMEKIHQNLLQPISNKAVDKWKKELTKNEIELIDYIAGDYATSKGYVRTTHQHKISYFFILIQKKIRFLFTYQGTRFYYKTPAFLRDIFKNIFKKLYSWFGYTTRFNKLKYTLEETAKQTSSTDN